MTDKPNPEDFLFVDKFNEFQVTLEVEGEIRRTITADSVEQARTMAHDMCDAIWDGNEIAELDGISYTRVSSVTSMPRMYLVTAENGRDMQVSRLKPGMKPRKPHENGF